MLPSSRLRIAVAVVAAAAALTGCGSGGGKSGATKSGGVRAGNTITIKDFKFDPTPLQVKSGQKITVTNTDSAAHTVTADDKSFDSKDLAQGKSYTFTAGKPGKYTYLCSIHNYMTGTITVS